METGSGEAAAPRIPRPLIAILAAVAIFGLTWALVVPAWQAPDEREHFAYVQSLAERLKIPQPLSYANKPDTRLSRSTEQITAAAWANTDLTSANIYSRPEWSQLRYREWRKLDRNLGADARSDGGGPLHTFANPPLYYAASAAIYKLGGSGDIFSRLFLMRLLSVLLLLATVTVAWLLAGEIFGRNRLLQTVTASFVGLEPMMTFLNASVTPDSGMIFFWTLTFYLGVRILRRGITLGRGMVFFAVGAAAVLTKVPSYALVPGMLLVLAIAVWRRTRQSPTSMGEPSRMRLAVVCTASVLAFAVPVGSYVAATRLNDRPALNQAGGSTSTKGFWDVRRISSYLWQFYLPKLPFQTRFEELPPNPANHAYIQEGWGAFGWLEVRYPAWVYRILAVFTLSVLVTCLVASVLRRRRGNSLGSGDALAFFGITLFTLLAGIHFTEYKVLYNEGGKFIQGRYVLPLMPLFGLAVAYAVMQFPPRLRSPVAASVVALLLVLNLGGLGMVLAHYYA